jgi:hypothetical protein
MVSWARASVLKYSTAMCTSLSLEPALEVCGRCIVPTGKQDTERMLRAQLRNLPGRSVNKLMS